MPPILDREAEVKACTAQSIVSGPQAAAVRFHDGETDGQSHAPVKLGRKKRIEDLVRLFQRQPNTSIANRNQKVTVFPCWAPA